jgi:hypothetical protein
MDIQELIVVKEASFADSKLAPDETAVILTPNFLGFSKTMSPVCKKDVELVLTGLLTVGIIFKCKAKMALFISDKCHQARQDNKTINFVINKEVFPFS